MTTRSMAGDGRSNQDARILGVEAVHPELRAIMALMEKTESPVRGSAGREDKESMTNSYTKTANKLDPRIHFYPAESATFGNGPPALVRRLIDRISARIVAATMALIGYEPRTESKTQRIVLPMSSGVNILPNTSAQVTSRPQNCAFQPERIVIGGTPGDWIVNDIKVGNSSQLAQSGDLPGELFAYDATNTQIQLATVLTAADFVLLVTYVGPEEKGAPFVCGVIGTATI